MLASKNQRAVENKLRECVRIDRARIQIGRISRFGLLEMSRQRLRPSLSEFSHEICPRCDGTGAIRSVKSTALAVLRLVEEESMKESTARVAAQMPVDVATYLLNEKRGDVAAIEAQQKVEILLIPNQNLETPHFEIQRVRGQDLAGVGSGESFEMVTEVESPTTDFSRSQAPETHEPAVKHISRDTPKPTPAATRGKPGLFKRFLAGLFGIAARQPKPEKRGSQHDARRRRSAQQNRRRPTRGGGRQQSENGRGRADGGKRPQGGRNNPRKSDNRGARRDPEKSSSARDTAGPNDRSRAPRTRDDRRGKPREPDRNTDRNEDPKNVPQEAARSEPTPVAAPIANPPKRTETTGVDGDQANRDSAGASEADRTPQRVTDDKSSLDERAQSVSENVDAPEQRQSVNYAADDVDNAQVDRGQAEARETLADDSRDSLRTSTTVERSDTETVTGTTDTES
jgi:ribonuclease E